MFKTTVAALTIVLSAAVPTTATATEITFASWTAVGSVSSEFGFPTICAASDYWTSENTGIECSSYGVTPFLGSEPRIMLIPEQSNDPKVNG